MNKSKDGPAKMNYEKWENLGWKQLVKKLPAEMGAYYVSGHEWFGIGIWENGKGWSRGFIGEWPYGDRGDIIDENCCPTFLNESVMWWKEICDYPYCGIPGNECFNMERFNK